ncbi:MAG: hypothetical protein ACRDSM_25810 [Pseudonocardiaceae bacterium]
MVARTGLRTRTRVLLIGIVLVGLVSAAGCGPTSSSSAARPSSASASAVPGAAACQQVGSTNFDKTKFVLHAGLAFGGFHHFIYAPYKAGNLHGFAALAKTGLAGLFTVHELKLAKAGRRVLADAVPPRCPVRQGQRGDQQLDQPDQERQGEQPRHRGPEQRCQRGATRRTGWRGASARPGPERLAACLRREVTIEALLNGFGTTDHRRPYNSVDKWGYLYGPGRAGGSRLAQRTQTRSYEAARLPHPRPATEYLCISAPLPATAAHAEMSACFSRDSEVTRPRDNTAQRFFLRACS